jgi:hypothetical protein
MSMTTLIRGEETIHSESPRNVILKSSVFVVCVGLAITSIGLIAWRPNYGLNPADEAFYLLAVDPPREGDAFNGLWAYYLRPIWQLSGWNIGIVRLTCLALFICTACILGQRTSAALGLPSVPTIAACASGAVGYYSLGLRTPSYNWLAVEAAALVAIAFMPLGYVARRRDATLAALGVFLAGMGKPTTGLLLLAGVTILGTGPWAKGRRIQPAAYFSLAIVGLGACHFLFVLPLGETISTLQRSSATMAAVDPEHYSLTGSVKFATGSALYLLIGQLKAGAFLGAMPLLALFSKERREWWITRLAAVSVGTVAIYSLGTKTWAGSLTGWFEAIGGVSLMVTTLSLALITASISRSVYFSARNRRLALLLLLCAVAAAWGSNTGFPFVLGFSGLTLTVLGLVLASSIQGKRSQFLSNALSLVVCFGILLTTIEGMRHPFSIDSYWLSAKPVSFGRVSVLMSDASANRFSEFSRRARSAGWERGNRLVDVAYSPSVGLVLGSEAPPALLPAFPDYPLESICEALDPIQWQKSWLLIPIGMTISDRQELAHIFGRDYQNGYAIAATWREWARDADLLKPVGDATWRGNSLCDLRRGKSS